jgi:ATP-dependent Clp protease ATP-binding subunit ClpA
MAEEETTPKETVTHEHIMDQLMPLRDRIVKMETIINYHDKEFQTVKKSIGDLTKNVKYNQDQILSKLEKYNKDYMDVMYEQYRETTESNTLIAQQIQENKNKFESYVAKWKAVQAAVWFTIILTVGVVGWGLSTAQDLGFFETHSINEQQTSQELVLEDFDE